MGSYEEAVEEIEAAYDEKHDAVEDKYWQRRVRKHERDGAKSPFKKGGALTGAGAGAAATLKSGIAPMAGVMIPFFGGPLAMGAGAVAGGAVGYVGADRGSEKLIDGYNRAMDGAERVEQGYLNTRESVSKGAARARSWASIDGLLGGSDDE